MMLQVKSSRAMLLLLFLCAINNVLSNSAPFITKCKHDDTKCMKEVMAKAIPFFADGIPDLKVEQLDPIKMAHIDASSTDLKLIVSNLTITGLKNCEAKKLSRDLAKSTMDMKLLCTVNLEGKYDMSGQLLVFPITGNGDVHAKIRKILINLESHMKEFNDKEGVKHWTVQSWKYNFNLKDKSDIKFENLFPNNEFLRKTTSDLIANNGNDVIFELGPPIIKAVTGRIMKSIENFLRAMRFDDLVLE